MAGMRARDDFDPGETFYEEDRPIEEVLGAYERGIKGITAPPVELDLSTSPVLQPVPSSLARPARFSWKPSAPKPIEVTLMIRVA